MLDTTAATTTVDPLATLVGVGRALSAARRVEDVVELVAEGACDALAAAGVTIGWWDPEGGVVRTLINYGELAPGQLRRPDLEVRPLGDHPELRSVLDAGRDAVYRADDPACPPGERALLVRLGRASSLSACIRWEGRVWGELHATRGADQMPFTNADLGVGEAVAGIVAVGLAQADHVANVARLAYADPLTGLANRRAVDEYLDAAMRRHRRLGSVVSLIVADVNGLKHVNDQEGHEAGDRLLIAMADALSAAGELCSGSLVARLGGDEFCIVVEGQPAAGAFLVAEDACRRARPLGGGHGLSCGVATTENACDVDTPARLFRLADAAQYRAKRSRAVTPVVAGNTGEISILDRVECDHAGGPGPGGDRRRLRARLTPDPDRFLRDVLEQLDASTVRGEHRRLQIVAGATTQLLNAAGWYISHVPCDSRVLTTVSSSVGRASESAAAAWWSPSVIGVHCLLDELPQATGAAVRGGGFVVELGRPENDPAEEALLDRYGYTAMVTAGGLAPSGDGWLVEVLTDEYGKSVTGLATALRAAVAVALLLPGGSTP